MLVEIWSDILCPWCAVGRAHLMRALEEFEHPVELRWRSFELDPRAPRIQEGDYVELLARKYGRSPAQAQEMIDQMTATAADAGLDFHFERVRPGNSFDAHRLLHLAAERGCQDAFKDRLFRAYLSEGVAVGDPSALQPLAESVGLDPDEVAETLAGDRYAEVVRADEAQAAAYGIRGVPFFVLDGRIGLSGAQPPEVIGQALERAWSSKPAPTLPAGPACDDDGCAI